MVRSEFGDPLTDNEVVDKVEEKVLSDKVSRGEEVLVAIRLF
jgi:hypothetical protein